MEIVKLTPKERASFIFQLRILQKLSDSSEFSDYEAKIVALERGYELHYSDVFDMLYDEGLSADECRSVLDILEMYRGIIFSYKQLKETSLTDEQVKFPGFDGNFEAKHPYLVFDNQFHLTLFLLNIPYLFEAYSHLRLLYYHLNPYYIILKMCR